jgi:hypothetical protein
MLLDDPAGKLVIRTRDVRIKCNKEKTERDGSADRALFFLIYRFFPIMFAEDKLIILTCVVLRYYRCSSVLPLYFNIMLFF